MAPWELKLKPRVPQKLINLGLELIFPVECLGCEAAGAYLCKDCSERCLYTAPLLVCPECGKPSPVGLTHPACAHPHFIDGIFAAGSFLNPLLKTSVKELKYRNLKEIAPLLAEFLKTRLSENFKNFIELYKPAISPVPLHEDRKNFRGYNQSELIAKNLSGMLELPFEEVLIRKLNTKDQTKLSREQRQENVKGAFNLAGEVKDKNYFIIDDVTTTGATFKECGKVLKRNGASAVWGVALAFEEFRGS